MAWWNHPSRNGQFYPPDKTTNVTPARPGSSPSRNVLPFVSSNALMHRPPCTGVAVGEAAARSALASGDGGSVADAAPAVWGVAVGDSRLECGRWLSRDDPTLARLDNDLLTDVQDRFTGEVVQLEEIVQRHIVFQGDAIQCVTGLHT